MNDFDKLVGEQLETMDELLKLQGSPREVSAN